MFHHRLRPPSKPQLFALLMLASAVLSLLPRGLLRPAKDMTQLMALAGWPARQTTGQIANRIKGLGESAVDPEAHARALREELALQNENASLRQQIEELQSTVEGLKRVSQRVPRTASIIPAKVVAADAAAGRESLMLAKGSSKNVRAGDWVASHLLVDAGTDDGVREQSAVLARECLIGWIEQSSGLASRVVLLTDALGNKALPVRIVARDPKRGPVAAGGKYLTFALSGAGQGRMKILEIPRDLVEAGRIRTGDLVTSDPGDHRLPVPMVVGEIKSLSRNKSKPVFYDAVVAPLYDAKTLNQVFVINMPARTGA